MNSNKVITANFGTIRYHLTTAVNDASGGSVTAGGDYDSGSMAQVTATANPVYVFTGWSGDAAGAANPLSVTINSNKTITAVFKAIYTLTVTVNGSGTVAPSPAVYYLDGDTVTLTAT